MSNIREYEKKKENSEDSNFRKKIFRHRVQVFYRILLGCLLIAAVIALLYLQMENRTFTEYQVMSSVERKQIENTKCRNYSGNILTYSNDGANCTDIKGNVLWNQTFEMQNPMVDISGDIAAIADYNGRKVYVMNKEGTMGEIETGMPIRSFCISSSGVVAAVLDDSNVNAISLFAPDGETIAYFKTTMQKSGYPIAVSISDNSEIVGISYLYVDSGVVTSNVAFYNFGPVGQNETDNYVSGYSYPDKIVPKIGFMNNITSFAVANDKLVIYKGKQIPKSEVEIPLKEEVKSIFYDEKYIGLVYANINSETKYKLDIYNDLGKLVHTQTFDLEYKDIYFSNECIVIYNETGCTIYNMKGTQKYNGDFKTGITTMLPTNKNYKYVIVAPDKIETIELK